MMRNILLTIEYDGTNFSGWQRQPGQRTVQGELERVLSVLCGQEIALSGTSRTDAGVHAYGQRASFKGDFGIPTERIAIAANNLLSGEGQFAVGDVRILKAEEMPEDFHARFNAAGKKYIYRIYNSEEPDIMNRNHCYWISRPLDIESMKEAAFYLTGEHDFLAFMASGGNVPESTVRIIYSAKLKEYKLNQLTGFKEDLTDYRVKCKEDRPEHHATEKANRLCYSMKSNENSRDAGKGKRIRDSLIEFEIAGNGFLYNMVRIITGTLVDIGLGKIKPYEMRDIIQSKDRRQAGHTAPPQGLYLAEVYFDTEKMHQNCSK